jgi:hypothetical protein
VRKPVVTVLSVRGWFAALSVTALCVGALAGGSARADEPVSSSPQPFKKTAPSMPFRCDGTDEAFFEEMKAAGTVGYGETWDASICDEGVEIYAEGATSRWKAFRKRATWKRDAEEQALALVLPLVGFGSIAAVLLGAAAVAAATRLRRVPTLTAACPACASGLPISVENGRLQHLFCPMCGAPCSVHIEGKGDEMVAEARA